MIGTKLRRNGAYTAALTAMAKEKFAENANVSMDIAKLNRRAIDSLVALFDKDALRFKESVTLRGRDLSWGPQSRRGTLVALLGLRQLIEGGFGGELPFDVARMEEIAFHDLTWVKSARDLGLLTWYAAVCGPDRLEHVLGEFDFDGALNSYEDAREAQTEGVAWFLMGVAQARLARASKVDLTDVAADAYRILRANQGWGGLFGHASCTGFPPKSICGRFGTLSDQMSAIFALATFAKAFDIEEPLESALACGNAMRRLQGDHGEWWFLYDAKKCRVVSRYPVCALHQCGLAASAMLALEERTGTSFWQAISRGISWMAGTTDGRSDFSNPYAGDWPAMHTRSRFTAFVEAALGFMSSEHQTDGHSLRVLYEARADCLGFVLQTFGQFGLPRATVNYEHAKHRSAADSLQP